MQSKSTLAHPRHASSTATHGHLPQRAVAVSANPSTHSGVPQTVKAALLDQSSAPLPPFALHDAAVELGIAAKRERLARGIPAAKRSFIVSKVVADALEAADERKWAHRLRQCGQDYWTVGCPNGHGGTVVASPMTKRCNLPCCVVCARLYARRLSAELFRTVRAMPQRNGFRWKFVTLSLKPRATHQASWDAICEVRTKVMKWLKGLGFTESVAAIEFGSQGHPHLHILVFGGWIDRDTLSRMLVGWTGGKVRELDPDEWVEVGHRRTKRGKKHFRKWVAVPPKSGVGGDWYADVREVKNGLAGAIREVAKYLANPFGDGVVADAKSMADLVGAARLAAAVAVAGKGRHRVQGYGSLRGIVGRALGKSGAAKADEAVAEAAGVSSVRCCKVCQAELVAVRRVDAGALAFFNRERVRELAQLADGPPPDL